jgi:hypothetical protein
MKKASLLLTILLLTVFLGMDLIPSGHATYTVGTITHITSDGAGSSILWQYEWSSTSRILHGQGTYYMLYQEATSTSPCTVASGNTCLFDAYSTDGVNWAGGTNPVPLANGCGEKNRSGPLASMGSTYNATFATIVCDNGRTSGTIILWLVQCRMVKNTDLACNAVQTVTSQANIITAGDWEYGNEMVRTNTNGKTFITWVLFKRNVTQSFPYVTECTTNACTSFDAPTQLSTTACGVAGGVGIGWYPNLFVLPNGKMMVLENAPTGDTTCSSIKGFVYQSIWTVAGGWPALTVWAASGSTYPNDGAAVIEGTDDNGGGNIWVEYPTPGHTNAGVRQAPSSPCQNDPGYTGGAGSFETCYATTWHYSDTRGTWGENAYLDPAHTEDEHGQLVYDSVTSAVYWIVYDDLCLFNPQSAIWLFRSQDLATSKGWQAQAKIALEPNPFTETAGGSNGAGCPGGVGNQQSGGGWFSAMLQTDNNATGQSYLGIDLLGGTTPFNLDFLTMSFTPDPSSSGGGWGGAGGGGGAGGTGPGPVAGSYAANPLFTPILLLSALTGFIVFIGIVSRPKKRRARR